MTYVYGGIWIFLGLMGMIFQGWMKHKSDQEEKENNKENPTDPMI